MSIFKKLFILIFFILHIYNIHTLNNISSYGPNIIGGSVTSYEISKLINFLLYIVEIHIEKKDSTTFQFLSIYSDGKIIISTQLVGNPSDIKKIWFYIADKKIVLSDFKDFDKRRLTSKLFYFQIADVESDNFSPNLFYATSHSLSTKISSFTASHIVQREDKLYQFFSTVIDQTFNIFPMEKSILNSTSVNVLNLDKMLENKYNFFIIGKINIKSEVSGADDHQLITYTKLSNLLLDNKLYYVTDRNKSTIMGIAKNNVLSFSDIGSFIVICISSKSCKILGQITRIDVNSVTYDLANYILDGIIEKTENPLSFSIISINSFSSYSLTNYFSMDRKNFVYTETPTQTRMDPHSFSPPLIKQELKKIQNMHQFEMKDTRIFTQKVTPTKEKVVDSTTQNSLGVTSSSKNISPNLTNMQTQSHIEQGLLPNTSKPIPLESSNFGIEGRKRPIDDKESLDESQFKKVKLGTESEIQVLAETSGKTTPNNLPQSSRSENTPLVTSPSNQRKRPIGANESQLIHEVTSQKHFKPVQVEIVRDTTVNSIPSNDKKEIKEITYKQLFEDCYSVINLFDIEETKNIPPENARWLPNAIKDLPIAVKEDALNVAIKEYSEKPTQQKIQLIEKAKNVRLTFLDDKNIYKVIVVTGNEKTDSIIDIVLLDTVKPNIIAFKCSKNIVRPILKTSIRNSQYLDRPGETFYESKLNSSTLQNENDLPTGVYHTTDNKYFQVIEYPLARYINQIFLRSKYVDNPVIFSDQQEISESVFARVFNNYARNPKPISELQNQHNKAVLTERTTRNHTTYQFVEFRISKSKANNFIKNKNRYNGVYRTIDNRYFEVKNKVIHELNLKDDSKFPSLDETKLDVPEEQFILLFSNYEPFNTLNIDSQTLDEVVIDRSDYISNDISGVNNPSDMMKNNSYFIPNHFDYANIWEYTTNSLGVVKFVLVNVMKTENDPTPNQETRPTVITKEINRDSKNHLLDAVESSINELTANYRY